MADYETVQLRSGTKRMLEAARHPGESFDAVVRRKLKEAELAAKKAFFDEMYAILDDRKSMKPLR